jgi:hypothetical protein
MAGAVRRLVALRRVALGRADPFRWCVWRAALGELIVALVRVAGLDNAPRALCEVIQGRRLGTVVVLWSAQLVGTVVVR